MTTQPAFNLRAIQLDLARQMESVDQVRRFIDFSRRHGYNTLFLYLEGRVRTATFSLPKEQSYSLEQIRAISEHATAAGMDTMLATATLAHAEHFFQEPRLRHLAEEREGGTRFGTTRCETFCPSVEKIYDFWRSYLAELLPVFPSPHLHVGCDEAFNLGYCPLCRARLRTEGLQGLFVQHLKRVHALCGEFGKGMWIWDDMFELFPEALAEIPRDIVLCYWMYEAQVEPEGGQAHFANRRRRDFLAEYARLGFECVFCPASYEIANVENLTRYASRRPVLGGLLTQWEMQRVDLAEYAPTVALAGELWSQDRAQGPLQGELNPATAWQAAHTRLLPNLSPAQTAAVKVLCSGTRKDVPPTATWLTGTLTASEMTQRDATRLALTVIESALAALPPTDGPEMSAGRVLHELALSARLRLVHWELQELAPRIVDPRRSHRELPELERRANAVRQELAALAQPAAAGVARRRAMYPTGGLPAYLTQLQVDLAPLWARLKAAPAADAAWIVLRLALMDYYGVPRVRVELEIAGQWQPVFEGKLKAPDVRGTPFFTARIPCRVAPDVTPPALRIVGSGYGGIGLGYAELQTATRRFLPAAVRVQNGSVQHADAVLIDDSRCADLGERDYAATMLDPTLADRTGTLTITLNIAP